MNITYRRLLCYGAGLVLLVSAVYKWALYAELPWFNQQLPIDQQMVEQVMEADGDDINATNVNGMTGLMIAAFRGYTDLARAFIERGADPYKRRLGFGYSDTALHIGVTSESPNSPEIIRMMLDHGHPWYLRDNFGKTPIHYVLQNKHEDLRTTVIDMLIEYGAQINDQDNLGNTLQHVLVGTTDKEYMKKLRARYANLLNEQVRNREGLTPLEWAIKLGPGGIDGAAYDFEYGYLANPVPHVYDGVFGYKGVDERTGMSSLSCLIYQGRLDRATEIIADGADLNSRDKQGRTALHWAFSSPRPVEAVKLLLEKNVDPNIPDYNGKTPLLSLDRVERPSERLAIAKALVERGASLSDETAAQALAESLKDQPLKEYFATVPK